MNKKIGDPTGYPKMDDTPDGVQIIDDFSGIFIQALQKEVEDMQEAAWKDFNQAVEADHERQMQRERAFWARHRVIQAGDIAPGMTLVERKGKKTHRNKVRNITKFGHLDRYRRIELYGTRILWSYHVDDEVLVEG